MKRIVSIGCALIWLLPTTYVLLPAASALAVEVPVHCWCKQQTSQICNHVERTVDVPLSIGGAFGDDRDTTCSVCRTYCAGLTGGPWQNTHCEPDYREEICTECAADTASSCTEAQGARRWSATHATSSLVALPQCPTEAASVFPVQLGVSVAGVSQVNGIGEYINIAYRYLVSVVLVVAIIMVVWGGFKYLLGASMSSVQSGKETIKDALIGMVLVLGAYMILSTVNPATTTLQLPAIEGVACRNLDIPNAVASNRCNEDSDCTSGNHCVETQYVFRTDTDQVVGSVVVTATGAGEEAGRAVFGNGVVGQIAGGALGYAGFTSGVVGAGIWSIFNIGGHIKSCSTGEGGAPCDSSQDCRPGLYCLTNWNLCTKKQNLPKGAPCGPLDGTGTIINDDTTCASGFECVPANSSVFARGIRNLAEGDYATCRGLVEPMLDSAAYVNNYARVPNSYLCSSQTDCSPGFDCVGPVNPFRGKYCTGDRNHQSSVTLNQTPCLRTGAFSVTTPLACNGTSDVTYTCVYCPASGERNWTFLAPGSEAAKTQIGVCQEKEGVIGTPCGH